MSGKAKNKKRSPKVASAIQKKRPKPRPGSRAVREVRDYQRTFGFLIPLKTFDRAIRLQLRQYTEEPKLDKGAREALQWDLENTICDVLIRTRERARLLGRKTCTAQHLLDTIKDDRYTGSFGPPNTAGLSSG